MSQPTLHEVLNNISTAHRLAENQVDILVRTLDEKDREIAQLKAELEKAQPAKPAKKAA